MQTNAWLQSMFMRHNNTSRRLQKSEARLEKQRAEAALNSIVREQDYRQAEDPREQAMMRQSLFARGLGKSTIAQQDTSRLLGLQARRNAALAEQRGIAEKSLSVLRKRRKAAKRLGPINDVWSGLRAVASDIMGVVGGVGGAPGQGGMDAGAGA